MVLARVASYLFPPAGNSSLNYLDDGRESPAAAVRQDKRDEMRRQAEELRPDMVRSTREEEEQEKGPWEGGLDAYHPPYLHAMLAGGIGGTTGDMLMHSLDTVKTRQQGDPHMPPKYTNMGNTYYTIFRQEGLWRGLYGGVTPAFLGSFGGTVIFFGCYEASKRYMIDQGVRPWMAYLTAGFFADLAASPLYVPTEVLKTRLQLQGRWNNPFFTSGYNYRSTAHALRTIYRVEGLAELFSGYKATLFRDLPFSALQFAFYEQEQKLAKSWVGPGNDIGLTLEILTGASAGGMAGVLTCPMDVVKTRIQTELDPEIAAKARQMRKAKKQQQQQQQQQQKHPSQPTMSSNVGSGMSHRIAMPSTSEHRPTPTSPKHLHHTSHKQPHHPRPISTSGPSTALKHHGQVTLDTESVMKALRIIYQTEGLAGWYRGVGPRAVWTSIQSGTMLVVYQKLLRWFDAHPLVEMEHGVELKGYSMDV